MISPKNIEDILSTEELKNVATGDCYHTAFNILEEHHEKGDKVKMVHGRPVNRGDFEGMKYGHAWVESQQDVHFPGGHTHKMDFCTDETLKGEWFPKAIYYMIGQIDPEENKCFTYEEAIEMMKTERTYGPWG